jgi:hypothetical protein
MPYTELSLTAQTAYAQFQDAALAEYLARSVARLNGSFSKKSVKGRQYWYFSFREGSRVRQIYVGPNDARVRALTAKKKEDAHRDAVETLARAYVAHGGTTLLPKHLRIIARLADFGFFHAGGVLIGTHAFVGYANLLGVRWSGGDRTMDVDLAMPGKNVSIAVPDAPQVNLHDALTAFESGFVPTHTFAGDAGPTYTLKGDPDFQIDFLTTLGRAGSQPRRIEVLGISAQPLKFLDYLVKAPTQTVLLDAAGRHAVVSLPAPARYAVHKVIVYGERNVRHRTKARKDLEQAAALFQYFAANDARSLRQAWDDAYARGPGWRERLDTGLAALERRWPLAEMGLQLTKPKSGVKSRER